VSPRRARERLWDIVEAAQRIQRHDAALAALEDDHRAHELYKDAVHYQLVVIGEAVNALPKDVTDLDPEIPWAAINGLRNRLAHEYFRIDAAQISETVRKDLPELIVRISALAKQL
jgi:uncharacterized protein with HEPN domain